MTETVRRPMHALLGKLPSLVGFAVAVLAASWLGPCIEVDGCLDAGGSFDDARGVCTMAPGDSYRAQFGRPELYEFWAIFLILVLVPARTAKWLLARLLRAFSKRPNADPS